MCGGVRAEVCVWAHTGDSPCRPHQPCPVSPVLSARPHQPCPSSGQAGASDAPGSGQPLPCRQPRGGSCCPGDTVVAQLVAPLRHSSCSCRNMSGTTGTTQVPSKINTLNCLRPTGASGRAKPPQEERWRDKSPCWDALARPQTLSHTLSWTDRNSRGAGGPLGRQTLAALVKNHQELQVQHR